MKKSFLALIATLILNPISLFAQREQDSLALVALYNSTNGPNWINKTNWLSSEPISNWFGVQLTNNRVTNITLIENNLNGEIPQEIANLKNLTDLNLYFNNLTGSIPQSISNLTYLKYLKLHGNHLSGTIPSDIGKLTKLVELLLLDNDITGSIPPEIGNLINLRTLELSVNQLTGSIPNSIGNLTSLLALNFWKNQLSGSIPHELGNLTLLQDLCLAQNQLSGPIPSEIGNLVNLGGLNFMGNHLSGSIPVGINNLSTVYNLFLNDNEFDALPNLTINPKYRFDIYNNRLDFGDIEPNLGIERIGFNYSPQDSIGLKQDIIRSINGTYTFMVICGGDHNQYQWKKNNIDIPSETSSTYTISSLNYSDAGSYTCAVTNTVVTGLTINSRPIKLTVVDKGREQDSLALVALYNSTCGPNWTNKTNWLSSQPISTWHGVTVENDRVTMIMLPFNNMLGSLPPQIGDLSELHFLKLDMNGINSIPKEIGKLSKLSTLILHMNLITGKIPVEIGDLSSLTSLEISDNRLTGEFPLELTRLNKLRSLGLGKNIINGNIPSEIENLTQLIFLNLSSNQLSGSIPIEFGNLSNLEYIDLSTNQLSGSIPSQIGNLSKTTYLSIYGNQLTGTIPHEIGNLTNLVYLDLSFNRLVGSIPIEIGNLIDIWMLKFAVNQLTGEIPVEINNLKNLIILDMSANKLTGEIPSGVWEITTLDHLGFRSNQLTGVIPPKLGNLTNLVNLHLSQNFFTGSIPKEINNLFKLEKLLIDYNKFDEFPALSLNRLNEIRIGTNRFTFEDIEPNISLQIYYSPQDSIGQEQNLEGRVNKKLTIPVACGGAHNLYQWKKNNIPMLGENKPKLEFPKLRFSDAGTYVCDITNSVVTGLTISSRPIHLSVTTNGRAKDSLALVTIYNTTGGANWTNNTNWLSSEPIDNWYGVTVGLNSSAKGLSDSTSVLRLDLSGNNLTGSIPQEIGTMTGLQSLDLSSNILTGAVPGEINSIPSIQTLNLSDNRLDSLPMLLFMALDTLELGRNQFSFVDLAPNINVSGKVLDYLIQDSIGVKKDTICFVGSGLTFSAEDNALYNNYQWYKDGGLIPSATNSTYSLTSLKESDAGKYHCSITNPTVPNLTLYTRLTKLIVSTPTGIKGNSLPGIRIYPNPTHGLIKIEVGNDLLLGSELSVCDYYGRIVYQKQLDSRTHDFDLLSLPKGLYFLHVRSDANSWFRKLVIH